MRVAHLGLGKMGCGIAGCIRSGGFDLTVWNRTTAVAEEFTAEGGRIAATPAAAVVDADVVTSCLFDDASLIAAVTGPEGILAGMAPGAVHVSTTTVSPATVRRLAQAHTEHGSTLIACPVLGRPEVARAGQLVGFVAGEPAAAQAARPVIEAFTREIVDVGVDPGLAAALKVTVNGTLVGLIELIGEMTALGESAGLDSALVAASITRLLTDGPAAGYAARIRDHDYAPGGFTLTGGHKDIQLARGLADETGASVPILDLARDRLLVGLAQGWADRDWAVLAEVSRLVDGGDVRPGG